jgi:hypothetical protein
VQVQEDKNARSNTRGLASFILEGAKLHDETDLERGRGKREVFLRLPFERVVEEVEGLHAWMEIEEGATLEHGQGKSLRSIVYQQLMEALAVNQHARLQTIEVALRSESISLDWDKNHLPGTCMHDILTLRQKHVHA